MTHPEDGRLASAGTWIRTKPVHTLTACLLATVTGVAVAQLRYEMTWTPLQRAYLSTYLKATLAEHLGLGPRSYPVLHVASERRPAVHADVGHRDLVWTFDRYDHGTLRAFLEQWIYGGQSLLGLAVWPLRATAVVLTVGLILAIPRDRQLWRDRKHGKYLQGPVLLTPKVFSEQLNGDGLSFTLADRSVIRLPQSQESSHYAIMGAIGCGKSSLIRQILQHIQRRRARAIIYDPHREYLPQFFDSARGDIVLNPLDARCPYWHPGDEIVKDAEAMAMAESLFPYKPHENAFFTDASRQIIAYLLWRFKPSAEALLAWLQTPAALDRLLEHTPYAHFFGSADGTQRGGVMADLNMIADAFNLLPSEDDAPRRWSAADWSTHGTGWLFLTNTPATRQRLLPLTTLWLDQLILRLMTVGAQNTPTWFVLDELASLNRLPQLHTAITENRKSQNPIVLAFQGRSQLDTRYGKDAETMISQPATRIFMRTTEPASAKWVSDAIGAIEQERHQESRARGDRGPTRTLSMQREVIPRVLPSVIEGLPNLTGYLKVGNLVTRITLPYVTLPARVPGFIERPSSRPHSISPDPTPQVSLPTTDPIQPVPTQPPTVERIIYE